MDPTCPVALTFTCADVSTSRVIVYNDRAEVTKVLNTQVDEGQHEIILDSLPFNIIQESVRVSGQTENGGSFVKILEVAYDELPIKQAEESPLLVRLKQEKDEHLANKQRMKDELQRWNQQLSQLDTFSGNVVQGAGGRFTSSGPNDLFSDGALDGLKRFFEFQRSMKEQGTQAIRDLEKCEKEINQSIAQIDLQIAKCNPNSTNDGNSKNISKRVKVSVRCSAAVNLRMEISFMVTGCSWEPSYDVRVASDRNDLQLTYYGSVTQTTGEDWKAVELWLSTAKPSVSGVPPATPTIRVRTMQRMTDEARFRAFKNNKMMKNFKGENVQQQHQQQRFYGTIQEEREELQSQMIGGLLADDVDIGVETSVSQESLTSSNFQIPNRTTIPSDSSLHKTTIAVLDGMAAVFSHFASPQIDPHTYMRATVENTSEFLLLEGDVHVFIDNSFICNSYIKTINPREKFMISLGQDNAVKIDARAPKRFEEVNGLLKKTKSISTNYRVFVKNTKKIPIEMTVTQQLPLAVEEQVKVKLQDPTLPSDRSGRRAVENVSLTNDGHNMCKSILLTNANNVEWRADIPANTDLFIPFQYVMEHPNSLDLRFM
eukprot:GILJ01010008.1.p1 GENE.GILJ01010008.1~~GILJ01010008.1.p1  ORF type:complete len:600 (-),score=110.45 GILJ01010008.1:136-1935(-)